MIFCLICGVGNRQGSRFCNACGRPLGAVQCEQCEAPNPQGSQFCSQCGAALGQLALEAPPREPPAFGGTGWQGSLAAAAILEDETTWLDAPAALPGRSVTGFQRLGAEDLGVFAAAPPAHVKPGRLHADHVPPTHAPAAPVRGYGYALTRARSWDTRRGVVRAPVIGTSGGSGLADLLRRIAGAPEPGA